MGPYTSNCAQTDWSFGISHANVQAGLQPDLLLPSSFTSWVMGLKPSRRAITEYRTKLDDPLTVSLGGMGGFGHGCMDAFGHGRTGAWEEGAQGHGRMGAGAQGRA